VFIFIVIITFFYIITICFIYIYTSNFHFIFLHKSKGIITIYIHAYTHACIRTYIHAYVHTCIRLCTLTQELVVAPPPVVASPAGVAPHMMHLLQALSNWRSIVPDHLNQPGDLFSVEAAHAVVGYVYRRELASWWSGIGAGSL